MKKISFIRSTNQTYTDNVSMDLIVKMIKSDEEIKSHTLAMRELLDNPKEHFPVSEIPSNINIPEKYTNSIPNPELQKIIKGYLPAFIATGNNAKKQAFATEFNGLMCIDYDKVPNIEKTRDIANHLNCTYLDFITSSNKGLKLIVNTDLKLNLGIENQSKLEIKYLNTYDKDIRKQLVKDGLTENQINEIKKYKIGIQLITEHITKIINDNLPKNEHITADKSNFDFTQLTFINHDPDVFYNPKSKVLQINDKVQSLFNDLKIEKETAKQNIKQSYDSEIIESSELTNSFKIQTINSIISWFNDKVFTDSYNEWLSIGFSLFNEFDEETAIRLYRKLSKLSPKYNDIEFDEMVSDIKHYRSNNRNNIYSIIKIANQYGYSGSESLEDAYKEVIDTYKVLLTDPDYKLKDDEHLTDILDSSLLEHKRLFILSETGTGKTTFALQLAQNDDYVYVCPNVSNVEGLDTDAIKIHGSGIKFETGIGQFVTTYDSLKKIKNRADKILILDEIHILFLALGYRTDAMESVYSIINEFKQVIIMTGTLPPTKIPFFDDFKTIRIERENPVYHDLNVVWYNDNKQSLVIGMCGEKKKGETHIIHMNSKSSPERIAHKLQELYNYKVLIYNANTRNGKEQSDILKNKEIPLDCDVLIITSAIETGVDILNKNVTKVFFMNDNLMLTNKQIVSRFRNTQPECYIFVKKDKNSNNIYFDIEKTRQHKTEMAYKIKEYIDLFVKEKEVINIEIAIDSILSCFGKSNQKLVYFNNQYDYGISDIGIEFQTIEQYRLMSYVNFRMLFKDCIDLKFNVNFIDRTDFDTKIDMSGSVNVVKQERESFDEQLLKQIKAVHKTTNCDKKVVEFLKSENTNNPNSYKDQTRKRLEKFIILMGFDNGINLFETNKGKIATLNRLVKQITNYFNIKHNQLPILLKDFMDKFKPNEIYDIEFVNKEYQKLLNYKVHKKMGLKILKELFNCEAVKVRDNGIVKHKIKIVSNLNFNV